jgi:perosamine synthetase
MLTHLEPPFEDVRFSPSQPQEFRPGLCPVAEQIQPGLIQLKTNYLNMERAKLQAVALKRTIEFFER